VNDHNWAEYIWMRQDIFHKIPLLFEYRGYNLLILM